MPIGLTDAGTMQRLVALEARQRLSRQDRRGDRNRRLSPRITSGGSGSCACPEIWCFLPINPDGGTWDLEFTFDGTNDTVTVDYNETSGGFETALLTHSGLSSSDFTVEGGPFPTVALYLIWDVTDSHVTGGYPTLDVSGLTSGSVTMHKFSKAS